MASNLDEEFINNGAKSVTEEEFEKVVNKSDEIREKFSSRGPLKRFIEDGKVLIALVKDYRAGAYRQIPYATIAAVVFVLIYVFNPLDLLPDVIPFLGVLDDATVVGASLMAIEQDLQKYKNWKQEQVE
jgi:uncharacterized membrane protein YkvA (DUF1232 family)